jgi:putative Mn2+ efflux pump MntP
MSDSEINELDEIENKFLPSNTKSYIEDAIVILLLILSFVGISITNFSPTDGYSYWIIMTFVFAFTAIIIGWMQSKREKHSFKEIIIEQSLHWGSSLLVVAALFSLYYGGHLDSKNSALVVLLILSLATFLDGVRIGWRFSLVGLYLGLSAFILGHFKYSMWIIGFLGVLIVFSTIYWESWQEKLATKKANAIGTE